MHVIRRGTMLTKMYVVTSNQWFFFPWHKNTRTIKSHTSTATLYQTCNHESMSKHLEGSRRRVLHTTRGYRWLQIYLLLQPCIWCSLYEVMLQEVSEFPRFPDLRTARPSWQSECLQTLLHHLFPHMWYCLPVTML